MKIAAILLAAGKSSRCFSKIPKQFLLLGDRQVYQYPLQTLIESNHFSKIIVTYPKEHEKELPPSTTYVAIPGGETRQESVFFALKALQDVDYVVICDAARPFLTPALLDEHIHKLQKGHDAVNTCIPASDTIDIGGNGTISSIPPREQFLLGQTPQSFHFQKLLQAHSTTEKKYTDDCALMLEAGYLVTYVEGSEMNRKITTSIDLTIADSLLPLYKTFA